MVARRRGEARGVIRPVRRGRRPRALILTADYPPAVWSGIGSAVEWQARAMAGLGVEVCVIVAGEGGTRRRTPGLTVLPLSPRRFPVDPARFDLVHLHSLSLAELAFELRRRFGLPVVYTLHGLVSAELAEGPQAAFWTAVQARVLALADRVVVLSRADRSALLTALPELAPRCSVVANGVPPAAPGTFDPRAPARTEGPVVFAGRFTRSKGVEVLAEAVPKVLERRRVRFELAGGHGDTAGRAAVRRLRSCGPAACRIRGWLGRGELERLFARARMVLVPSLYEPFGLVALEAMRTGAPVLAAAVGGLLEVVGPRASGGRLVASAAPDAWAAAVVDLLDRPRLAAALGRRGPSWVSERFSAERAAERLVAEVYERVSARQQKNGVTFSPTSSTTSKPAPAIRSRASS